MSLKEYSVSELQEEIERRLKINKNFLCQRVEDIDIKELNSLRKLAITSLEELSEDNDISNTKQFIYEEVMELFYGNDFWERFDKLN
jgi:hypothetical protein